MSHVFSINCNVLWSATTPEPKSLKYDEGNLYPSALDNQTLFFPLDWVFGLLRAITKLCNLVEQRDIGMTPIAIFDVDSNEKNCEVAVRVRASRLAIKFLVRFLNKYEGWNSSQFYPNEHPQHLTNVSDSGETKIPFITGCKNVCSAAFSTLCKICKLRMDDSNRRFWWSRVEKIDNLIFMSTLQKLRCETPNSWTMGILTLMMREEAKIIGKNLELGKIVASWNNNRRISLKLDAAAAASTAAAAASTAVSTAAAATAAANAAATEYLKRQSIDDDLKRLRSCNFPPRLAPNSMFVKTWQPHETSFSEIGIDSIMPFGMKMKLDGSLMKSIW